MFTLTIFGLELNYNSVYRVLTILDLCDIIGFRLARLCFHKKLLIGGNCRFCLCNVLGERKHVIGCFYKIRSGIVIRSIAQFFYYFKFLLFLILNHPTDCPLCDQIGICEIQNIFSVFGTALRLRGYVTSSFYSCNIGFFVQFVMTRCIHCLRCVRFMREIVFINSWGFYGRGKALQVGLYVRSFLNVNFIDSLIKICPVGALTSKMFAFEVRNWELSKVYFVNIYNCLVEYISVSVCNSIICRVVGISKESIFSCNWLLDNIKDFVYNSMYQRICVPFAKICLEYCSFIHILSWNAVFFVLCNLLGFVKKCGVLRFVSVFYSHNLDMFSFFYIKKTFLLFNIYNFNTNYFTDLTSFFKINNSQYISKSDFWFLIGLEFETKFVSFGLKLKEMWKNANVVIFCLGFFEFWTIPVYFLGTVFNVYWGIVGGVSKLLSLFLSFKYGIILINSFVLHLFSFLYGVFFFFDLFLLFKKVVVWGVLSIFSNFVGSCFLNFTFKNTMDSNINLKKIFFFFDNANLFVNLVYSLFACYVGTYLNRLVSMCDIVLPLFSMVEKSKVLYMDIFGKLKGARNLINKVYYVASDFFIFFLLRNLFFYLFNDNSLGRWCLNFGFNLLRNNHYLIYNNKVIFYLQRLNINRICCDINIIGSFIITDFINGLLLQDVLQLLIA